MTTEKEAKDIHFTYTEYIWAVRWIMVSGMVLGGFIIYVLMKGGLIQ